MTDTPTITITLTPASAVAVLAELAGAIARAEQPAAALTLPAASNPAHDPLTCPCCADRAILLREIREADDRARVVEVERDNADITIDRLRDDALIERQTLRDQYGMREDETIYEFVRRLRGDAERVRDHLRVTQEDIADALGVALSDHDDGDTRTQQIKAAVRDLLREVREAKDRANWNFTIASVATTPATVPLAIDADDVRRATEAAEARTAPAWTVHPPQSSVAPAEHLRALIPALVAAERLRALIAEAPWTGTWHDLAPLIGASDHAGASKAAHRIGAVVEIVEASRHMGVGLGRTKGVYRVSLPGMALPPLPPPPPARPTARSRRRAVRDDRQAAVLALLDDGPWTGTPAQLAEAIRLSTSTPSGLGAAATQIVRGLRRAGRVEVDEQRSAGTSAVAGAVVWTIRRPGQAPVVHEPAEPAPEAAPDVDDVEASTTTPAPAARPAALSDPYSALVHDDYGDTGAAVWGAIRATSSHLLDGPAAEVEAMIRQRSGVSISDEDLAELLDDLRRDGWISVERSTDGQRVAVAAVRGADGAA